MLTDTGLQKLKPKEKLYKKGDRDGLYAAVLPSGAISFRYNYRINGRGETLTVGRYDAGMARNPARDPATLEYGMDVSLAEARTLLDRARRDVERGESPSRAKVEKRTQAAEALTFGGWAEGYFTHKADPRSGAEQLAESTLAFRRSTYRRVIEPELGKLRLEEVTPQRLKRLCDDAKAKRGPAVAIHVREVVQAVFRHAQGSGQAVTNPAEATPTHKLWVRGNHKPIIADNDEGIWRRIALIPFDRNFSEAEQDKRLEDRLLAEREGILAWLVAGYAEYQLHGLRPAKRVAAATAAYRDESDLVGQWLSEAALIDPAMVCPKDEAYVNYTAWCGRQGVGAMSKTSLTRALDERGISAGKTSAAPRVPTYKGFCLASHNRPF